jgi:hypothetical protein
MIAVTITLVVVLLVDIGLRVALAVAGFVILITTFTVRVAYQVKEATPKDVVDVSSATHSECAKLALRGSVLI